MEADPTPTAGLTYTNWLRQNPPAIRRLLGWWPWLRYCWTGKLDVPRSLLPSSYWRDLHRTIDATPLTDAQRGERLDRIRRAMRERDA